MLFCHNFEIDIIQVKFETFSMSEPTFLHTYETVATVVTFATVVTVVTVGTVVTVVTLVTVVTGVTVVITNCVTKIV